MITIKIQITSKLNYYKQYNINPTKIETPHPTTNRTTKTIKSKHIRKIV